MRNIKSKQRLNPENLHYLLLLPKRIGELHFGRVVGKGGVLVGLSGKGCMHFAKVHYISHSPTRTKVLLRLHREMGMNFLQVTQTQKE
jgi:hypothetical protein